MTYQKSKNENMRHKNIHHSQVTHQHKNQQYQNQINPVWNLKHNIVQTSPLYTLCRFIPKGHKVQLQFYQSSCILSYVRRRKDNIKRGDYKQQSYHITSSFHPSLGQGNKGTVVYGTLFHVQNCRCFTIEDVWYFKSQRTKEIPWPDKDNYMIQILQHIKQDYFGKNSIIIGSCVSRVSKTDLMDVVQSIDYPIYGIQHLYYNQYKIERYHNDSKIFKIKADILPDIYHLYNENECIGQACIPDYKSSVMMNMHFRNIKENENLDALEESDDEEEFQNESLDKYVDMKKELYFRCKWNKEFHLWVPIEISKERK